MESGGFITDLMVYKAQNVSWRTYGALRDRIWDRAVLDRRPSNGFLNDRTHGNSCFTDFGAPFSNQRCDGYFMAAA